MLRPSHRAYSLPGLRSPQVGGGAVLAQPVAGSVAPLAPPLEARLRLRRSTSTRPTQSCGGASDAPPHALRLLSPRLTSPQVGGGAVLAQRGGGMSHALSMPVAGSELVQQALLEAMDRERRRMTGPVTGLAKIFTPTVTLAWTKRVQAARESDWMRSEVASHMQGVGPTQLPQGCGEHGSDCFTLTITRPLEAQRGGTTSISATRSRPVLADYILHQRKLFFINFNAPEPLRRILDASLGSVPCGNLDCCGRGDGTWDTTPIRWSCSSCAPRVRHPAPPPPPRV